MTHVSLVGLTTSVGKPRFLQVSGLVTDLEWKLAGVLSWPSRLSLFSDLATACLNCILQDTRRSVTGFQMDSRCEVIQQRLCEVSSDGLSLSIGVERSRGSFCLRIIFSRAHVTISGR